MGTPVEVRSWHFTSAVMPCIDIGFRGVAKEFGYAASTDRDVNDPHHYISARDVADG
jgi:hypothetical protein